MNEKLESIKKWYADWGEVEEKDFIWLVEQVECFEQFKLQFEKFQTKYEEFQKNWEKYDSERKDPFFKGYKPKQYFNLD